MKRLSVLFAAVILAGCQDHSPTGIESRSAPAGGASHATTTVDMWNARLAIDDAVDRIVPTLRDVAAARQVGDALKQLQQALHADNVADGATLAVAVRDAMQRCASLDEGDAAQVDAIRQALAVVTIQKR